MPKKKWKTTAFPSLNVEAAVLSGDIVERQQDHETDEWKYLVAGKTLDDENIIVVAKLSLTDRLVIVTVYLENHEYEN